MRLDQRVGRLVGEALAAAPLLDLRPPFADLGLSSLLRLPGRDHRRDGLSGIGDDAEIDLHHLVDLRRVDIEMDFLGRRREGGDAARHAVVEARAQADHQVAIMHGMVGFPGAVHA